MKNPTTSKLLRSLNRTAILDCIRLESPIARTKIARQLGLSIPTVMRVVNELIEEGLVCSLDDMEATGGRPRPLVSFDGKSYAAIGIDLGGSKMFGTVADLDGKVLHERFIPWNNLGPEASLEGVCELITELIDLPRSPGQLIRGIGIGAPGITDSDKGIVTWAPSLGWRDLPLKKILYERFHLPVFVENDVNLTALGEFEFGAGKGTRDMVAIAIGTGIGAGIIIEGALYRGHRSAAGEIGYLLPGRQFLGKRYDKFGALESLASGTGIAARAQQLLGPQALPDTNGDLSASSVFEAARQGEAWAQQVVDETVDYLTIAIVSVSTLLDPELIVLGGGVASSADLLIAPIMQRTEGLIPSIPRIVASSLGRRAAVMGAITLVLKGTSDYFVVMQPFPYGNQEE